MNNHKCFFLALAGIVWLTSGSTTLSACDKKSKSMRDMAMNNDMPMCCKMKMDKAKAQDHAAMGSTDADEISATGDEKHTHPAKSEGKVKDPVCSMTVDPKTAEKSVYKGKTYYFCSLEDKQKFEKSPEKYTNPEKAK